MAYGPGRDPFQHRHALRRPWLLLGLLVCSIATATLGESVAEAASARRLSVLYGVTGKRLLEASGRVTRSPHGARGVLETRSKGKVRIRARGRVRGARVRLRWHYPGSSRTLVVRVRVIAKRKTIATGRWRTIRVANLPTPTKVATAKASQVQSATPAGQAGAVVLSGNRSLHTGEVLALGVGNATPDGMLARITHVTHAGGATIASTVPATLPEVLPAGDVDLNLNAIPSASVRSQPRAGTPFSRAITCSNGARIEAGGSASLSANVNLHVGWKFPFRVTARFEGVVQASSELKASVSGEASCTLASTPLLAQPIRLGAYTFTIGPVPVVLIPTVQFYLSASGQVQAGVSTSIVSSLKANAGVEFDGGSFKPFGGLTPSFTFTPPALMASGTAQAAISPTLNVLIDGIGGPRVDLTAGLKLAADINAHPWWRLTAPISLGAQLGLDIWKFQLHSDRLQVFYAEPQIAAAATVAPPRLPPTERAQLTWDNDSDVDLHIWDESGHHTWYQALDGIPGARLLEDIIPGFGPEHFVEDAGHGRRYTYGVCLYHGTDVNTTVHVTDPNGASRELTSYLPDEKSAALITTSPLGGGFIPEPGWCGDNDPVTLEP